jgi:DNA invertase Pin-like site-specific DNA recombinase
MTKQHAMYMRVSTKRQDTASQEPELRRWAESHEGDSHWYLDTYSGTSMDRPGFRQLMRDIESGRVDTLVVWRLDRLGRTAKGLTSLFEDLIRCKANLISLKDGPDLVTPAGRLMANILAGWRRTKRRCGPSASWRASRRPPTAACTGAARRAAGGSR